MIKAKHNHPWTEEDEQIIIDNAAELSNIELGRVLGRTSVSIKHKRARLNLPPSPNSSHFKQGEQHPDWKDGLRKSDPAKYMKKLRNANLELRERDRVRSEAGNALRRGLIKRLPCVICGDKEVEMHHRDYTKPLEVDFLCKRHHVLYHLMERQIEEE